MPNKKRKTNRNKPRKNKTKKAGSVLPPEYNTDIADLHNKLNEINNNREHPNAFRDPRADVEVIDFNEDLHHDFVQFRRTYNTWEQFFNDIRNYYNTMDSRQRLRLFSYIFLLWVLYQYPGPNRNNINTLHFNH
tara:strand:+ start:217 stop:618 length:402 start_codon:yes stop_codon:yes gene_type:complete